MGANAQTAVPTFTASQVLTAAQQNQINTGIPVFASTTTRDAAFGGSNKTLAQGQYCYIEATSALMNYNGSAWVTVGTSATTASNARTSSAQTTTSTTYADLTTVTSVTLTTTTNAIVFWQATIKNDTANSTNFVSVAVSGATTIAAADTNNSYYQSLSTGTGQYIPVSNVFLFNTLTAGSNTFTMKYKVSGGTATVDSRQITVVTF